MNLNARHILHHQASLAIFLRGGLVAGNVAVLLGLAFALGLDGFGTLIVLWGVALVGATLLGFGGPLNLLARLSDGAGMRPRAVIGLCVGLPSAAATLLFIPLTLIWKEIPWAPVLALALAINLAACLASIMRALGSVHLSMAFRDGAPMLALGLAGAMGMDTVAILWVAATMLGGICGWAGLACLRHPERTQLIGRDRPAGMVTGNLWATAVLGTVLAQIDIIAGGQFLSPEQIGLYALLRRMANLVALPISVATWVSAAPISAAHAAGDRPALQRASLSGGRIALVPGLVLAVIAAGTLPLLAWWMPTLSLVAASPVLLTLLGATIVQLVFAQGFTVATLTGYGHLAAMARLAGVLAYLAAMLLFAPLDPLRNALAYAGATTFCSALLWLWLLRGLRVNTLAWQIGGRVCRIS